MYVSFIKKILDIIGALVVLILTSPISLISIAILFFTNKGRPFFLQERPGENGKIFKIIKLKTMNDKKDVQGNLLPYEKRITKTGSFIRKYSIDEIPQLINVLKGDMSLIGPRPLLVKYLPLYNEHQKRRHNLKPGITGWAQVNGRNTITWKQKFNYDIYYIDHITLSLDIKIFFLTLKKVFLKDGVNNEENLNMPEFTGTSKD